MSPQNLRYAVWLAVGLTLGGAGGFGAGFSASTRHSVNVVAGALAENEAYRHQRDSLWLATHSCSTLLTSPLQATIR